MSVDANRDRPDQAEQPDAKRERPARIRMGSMELRRGKMSGLPYLVGFFGATRIIVLADPEWQPDPSMPEVEAGYSIFIEALPDRSPYRERVEKAGRRPNRATPSHSASEAATAPEPPPPPTENSRAGAFAPSREPPAESAPPPGRIDQDVDKPAGRYEAQPPRAAPARRPSARARAEAAAMQVLAELGVGDELDDGRAIEL